MKIKTVANLESVFKMLYKNKSENQVQNLKVDTVMFIKPEIVRCGKCRSL